MITAGLPEGAAAAYSPAADRERRDRPPLYVVPGGEGPPDAFLAEAGRARSRIVLWDEADPAENRAAESRQGTG